MHSRFALPTQHTPTTKETLCGKKTEGYRKGEAKEGRGRKKSLLFFTLLG